MAIEGRAGAAVVDRRPRNDAAEGRLGRVARYRVEHGWAVGRPGRVEEAAAGGA